MTYDVESLGPGLGHVLLFFPVCITNLNHDVKARNDNSGPISIMMGKQGMITLDQSQS